MLKKIQCDKFISKGQVRPPIEFNKGLNTILGGVNANNSIGKSTLLLIIDFAYGGNSYLDCDAVNQVGLHTINFEFEFNDSSYFFLEVPHRDLQLINVMSNLILLRKLTLRTFCLSYKNNMVFIFMEVHLES